MKKTLKNCSLLLLILYLSSCASNRKFDFHSAYKFKTIQYKKVAQEESEKIQIQTTNESGEQSSTALNISTKIKPLVPYSEKPQSMVDLNYEFAIYSSVSNNLQPSRNFDNMTRTEKKQLRKDVRQVIRDITR